MWTLKGPYTQYLLYVIDTDNGKMTHLFYIELVLELQVFASPRVESSYVFEKVASLPKEQVPNSHVASTS